MLICYPEYLVLTYLLQRGDNDECIYPHLAYWNHVRLRYIPSLDCKNAQHISPKIRSRYRMAEYFSHTCNIVLTHLVRRGPLT